MAQSFVCITCESQVCDLKDSSKSFHNNNATLYFGFDRREVEIKGGKTSGSLRVSFWLVRNGVDRGWCMVVMGGACYSLMREFIGNNNNKFLIKTLRQMVTFLFFFFVLVLLRLMYARVC